MNRLVNKCQVSEAWDLSSSDPHSPFSSFHALWDTGATSSMISQSVVDKCGLVPIGFTDVQHAQGTTKGVPVYIVNIGLPNRVEIPGVRVVLGLLPVKPQKIDVLIGMDIITQGDFAVTSPNGKTQFSFRVPSCADIDFVREEQRNDLVKARAGTSPSPQKRRDARRRRKKKNR